MSKMRHRRKSSGALGNTFGAGSGGCSAGSRKPGRKLRSSALEETPRPSLLNQQRERYQADPGHEQHAGAGFGRDAGRFKFGERIFIMFTHIDGGPGGQII